MGLYEDFKNFRQSRKEPENENIKKPINMSVLKKIVQEQLDRSAADIKAWRTALTLWEDVQDPDRTEILRLYQEVEDDDDVSTSVETILSRVLSEEFEILDENGEVDEDKTKLFDGAWFDELVKYIIEADFYGHSLIEVLKRAPGVYHKDNINLIDRPYVIPELRSIRTRQSSNVDLIDYSIPKLLRTLIEAGDKFLLCRSST